MEYRELGRTGWKISAISLGTWPMGSEWGPTDERESLATLHRALDLGVNFFDTADAKYYGSEPLLARLHKERHEPFYVATKIGRNLEPHVASGYNHRNLNTFVEQCLKNLETDSLDLVQLHTPPTEVYYRPEVFGILDNLSKEGKIRYYGVSVEKIEEALKAIEYPNLQSVQIIFNVFRQRPADEFFLKAKDRRVGIIARVPLASGLLAGKMTRTTSFPQDDHRAFNRDGSAFDRGETFSGVDFEAGLQTVEELRPLAPKGMTLAQFALRWILMFEAVSCAIPGARRPQQIEENTRSADAPPLSEPTMARIRDLYNRRIRSQVHDHW